MVSSPDWLERYRAGQQDRVWHELRQLGSAVREPGVREQAQLVCDQMARRARHNIEMIIERLTGDSYRFHDNTGSQAPVAPHVPPTASAAGHAQWLEERFGPVPMTVLSWVRLVGDVWLVGTHPQWATSAAADPLVIELEGSRFDGASIRRYFEEGYEGWRKGLPQLGDSLFTLEVAPDRFHKANVSGGQSYGIIVPDGSAEGLITGEVTMPFVSYLNWVFRNGGFPWPEPGNPHWQIRRVLAKNLLPL
jgi:hypothetical protein